MFTYDPFQKKAIDHINAGHSVIVSAPTGAGKTVIAEHVINDCLKKDTKVIYTAPIKALSNQKYRDFQEPFGDKIGILTGDVSINPHAPVLIMTTEIFRNKILEETDDLRDYSWIIFDEIHYLDDYERGTVWEESLIFLPEHMRLLGLSATIPNIDQFAEWIISIHKKPIHVVKEAERPVPLHFYFQCQGRVMDNINKLKPLMRTVPKRKYWHKGKRYVHKERLRPNRLDALIRHLSSNDRLPCIYFAFGRRRCEMLADEMHGFDFLTGPEKDEISILYASLLERFDLAGEKSAAEMLPLIERGIAFHHAGMLPTLKEVIERLFTSKLIKVIFTTETFALGINMPARTVIFDELRKFYGRFFANLKTRDFYQMAGRAGRRGIDTEGFVYSRVNPRRLRHGELSDMIYGPPERVRSRFNASYATLMNLYQRFGEDLYDIYPLSFHCFQERKRSRERAIDLMRAKVELLKNMGYIDNGELTEKGEFASKIYGYELPLTELHETGALEHMSENELAITALALVYEPRKGTVKPPLSRSARKLARLTRETMKPIHRSEKKGGIRSPSKDYFFHLSPAVEAWLNGEEFGRILQLVQCDEGELIRYFRMSIQILREVLDTPISDTLRRKIRNIIKTVNRDIIDAENQLRG